jgi:hypothetical protein
MAALAGVLESLEDEVGQPFLSTGAPNCSVTLNNSPNNVVVMQEYSVSSSPGDGGCSTTLDPLPDAHANVHAAYNAHHSSSLDIVEHVRISEGQLPIHLYDLPNQWNLRLLLDNEILLFVFL